MKSKVLLITMLVLMGMFSIGTITNAQDIPSIGLAPYVDSPNQVINASVVTDAWNSRAFGYRAYPTPTYWVKFFLNSPGTLTSIGSDVGNFVTAASFTPNGLYCIRYGVYTLFTVDTTTGTFTTITPITGMGANQPTGMAYDWTTSTMYVMAYGTTSQLYTLNLTTGAATAVGSGQVGLVIDIGCSSTGNLYGVEIMNDNFVMINKTTGALTVIGPIGFNANYAQGMSWDHSTDSCFLAAYNATTSLGELRRVNMQTGATILVGTLGVGQNEIDGFAIPGAPGGSGIKNISNEVPADYELGQNYPNPFNPVTNIQFSIPKQGLVTLKVFDLLGREVTTLVNEILNPGSYTFEFNASNFTSGVYFYKIETNGFVNIKKMTLVK